jgi:hypothetical protein
VAHSIHRAHGGWTVQVIELTGTPDHHDGQWIRVSQYGFWVADVRTITGLERWFPLAELTKETLKPAA